MSDRYSKIDDIHDIGNSRFTFKHLFLLKNNNGRNLNLFIFLYIDKKCKA